MQMIPILLLCELVNQEHFGIPGVVQPSSHEDDCLLVFLSRLGLPEKQTNTNQYKKFLIKSNSGNFPLGVGVYIGEK